MPLYMDLHILPGVKASEVAEAHRRDMLIQGEHSCTCMTYWIDEKRGNVFCLIDAPDKKAVEEMHSRAHGLIPNKIIAVNSGLVDSFLGRIHDPEDAVIENGLSVFEDPSFRIIMVTTITDPVLIHHNLGKEKGQQIIRTLNDTIRKELRVFNGSEVEHEGAGFIVSFTTAAKAMACAQSIQQKVMDTEMIAAELRIAITAGEPIANTASLFGDTIQLAENLCAVNLNSVIAISDAVKELMEKDYFKNQQLRLFTLAHNDEVWLVELFKQLEQHFAAADFNSTRYGKALAMSDSQLYRKTIAVTGTSPNVLLNNFRLEKAKKLLKKKRLSIAAIAFETGFSSPSYFTKCFKKKYGLLPLAYIDLLK